MANYLMAYRGGGMAPTEEERARTMQAWGEWFAGLGPAIVDAGSPFSASATIGGDAPAPEAAITGYTILTADTLEAAGELTQGCPVLAEGGSVDVYEIHPVM